MEKSRNSTINLYLKQYVNIEFERTGLFETVKKRYGCREVLYPGSSVHLTPSLIFSHVVYVDNNAAAAEFFADEQNIQIYVKKNKRYKQSAYIRFIPQDYTTPLPLRERSFDLLIALYADGVAQACKKHLKVGGILLTNNHQNEIARVVHDPDFRLRSVIQYRGRQYQFFDDVDDFVVTSRQGAQTKVYLRSTSRGAVYRENIDVYFIFERCGGERKDEKGNQSTS
jgi:hypothetical protein